MVLYALWVIGLKWAKNALGCLGLFWFWGVLREGVLGGGKGGSRKKIGNYSKIILNFIWRF